MKRIGQHEHIVSMIGCMTRSHPVCLIIEYCSHGDLYNYLIKGRSRVRRLNVLQYIFICICITVVGETKAIVSV